SDLQAAAPRCTTTHIDFRYVFPSLVSTACTTASAVIPNFLYSSLYGALAPNDVMPTKMPSEPMIASQPWRTAASTPTLTLASPMMERRYGSCCSSNSSNQGTDITRAAMPRSASNFAPSTAMGTSEPVAKIETSERSSGQAIS